MLVRTELSFSRNTKPVTFSLTFLINQNLFSTEYLAQDPMTRNGSPGRLTYKTINLCQRQSATIFMIS